MPTKRLYTVFAFSLYSIACYAQDWKSSYNSSMEKGSYHLENGTSESAISFFKSAYNLSLSEKDSLSAIQAGYKLADTYKKLSDYDGSIHELKSLFQIFSSNTPSSLKGEISYDLSLALEKLGKYEESNDYYRLGLKLVNKSTDTLIYAKLCLRLANGLISFAKYDEALDLATEGIAILTTLNDLFYLSKGNLYKYVIYLYMGDLNSGEPFLFEHFRLAKELENNNLLSDSFLYLSDYYQRKENLALAIYYSEKGLQLAEELKSEKIAIRYYEELGSMYQNISDDERALNYFNRVYAYYTSINNQNLANSALFSIAECLIDLGNEYEAEKALLQTLEFYAGTNYHYDHGYVLVKLAMLMIKKNESIKALEYLKLSRELSKQNNIVRILYPTLELMLRLPNSIFSAQEKLAVTKELYTFSNTLDPAFRLRALKAYSTSFANIESDSAFYYSDVALNLIEKKRLRFSGGTLKASLFSSYASYYNEVASWYLTLKKDKNKAFELIEASKSRALLDQLAEANSDELLTLSEDTELKLLELQKKIDVLYRQKSSSSTLPTEMDDISNNITDAELEYEVALETVRRNNAAWSSFIYPKNITLTNAQELCDSKTGILEYALLEDGLIVMLITARGVYHHTVVNQSNLSGELISNINQFRTALIASKPKNTLSELSAPIYKLLLEPLETHLQGLTNLIIVPDGPIALLPFDAMVHNNAYLVSTYTIKTLPSISVFNQIQNPHRTSTSEIFAVAGSGFNSKTLTTGTASTQTSLPFTLLEVDSVASRFLHRKILKSDAVSEVGIKNLSLDKYKYLHFATHGEMNENAPNQSGLMLSTRNETEQLFGEDGFLTAAEIRALHISADMVVLSACNTANGKIQSGEGLLGLQRAFLVAGASSVVASLWSIYDQSTPVFMTKFYSNLIENKQKEFGWVDKFLVWGNWYEPELIDYKTRALRETKLQMLDHPYYNHPVHWAAFTITGK